MKSKHSFKIGVWGSPDRFVVVKAATAKSAVNAILKKPKHYPKVAYTDFPIYVHKLKGKRK